MGHEIRGQHLIAGQWRSLVGANFSASNPATGQTLQPSFAEAGAGEVNAALEAASDAFEQSLDLPPKWPADLLDAMAAKIMDLGDALLERVEQEAALPRPRLTGERARTCGQMKMFADIVREGSWVEAVIDSADPKRSPLPRPDLRRMLRARGPVAIFGASNFPLAFGTCGGDTAAALAAGNPVVVKGHPSHPGTSELLASAVLEAINDCKLPVGLFALLQGKSYELSGMLVKHPATQAVGFTGSQQAGRALFDIAARRPSPIPVYAEMGSLNPMVILPGALAERGNMIAEHLAASILMGGGQFCTKPGLIFTIGDQDRQFIDMLARRISATAQVTMLNANLRDNFNKRTTSFSTLPGVQVVVQGRPTQSAGMTPVLVETTPKTWNQQRALHEEAFGPGALVIRCESAQEALDCLRSVGGSLTGTVHTGKHDDPALRAQVVRELEQLAGRVIVNGYPTGVEVGRAIVHGGPYPATTDPGSTSVGSAAMRRFTRMIAYQDTPDELLPPALADANPLGIERMIDGKLTRDPLPVRREGAR